MPSDTYISDIAINDLTLVGEHLALSQEPPRGGLDIGIEVSNSHTTNARNDEQGGYMVQASVGVHVTLTEPDEQHTVRADLSVDTFVVATMAQGTTGEQESYRRLRVEAVRAGYEFARARMAEMAAISPLQHLNLPAVDPEKVVAHISADDSPDTARVGGGTVLDV